MKLKTLMALFQKGRLPLIWRLAGLLTPFYRGGFVSAAASAGLLPLLAGGPLPLPQIAAGLKLGPEAHEALAAWLEVGVRLGELEAGPEGYSLRGRLARRLADPEHDSALAFLEEALTLHYDLIRRTPSLLRENRRFTLADQDGELIARSSRIMEPLVYEAIDLAVPRRGPVRLLEVGCGSGTYMKYAAQRNPQLTALGVELQPEVADAARRNLAAWQLGERVTVEAGDIRGFKPAPEFDVVTLHNNIYYFPWESRPGLLTFLRGFLKPGGRLLITTGCRGGSAIMALLNLWGAATQGCGRLPTPAEMVEHLKRGGFTEVQARRLYPGEAYYAFFGSSPGPAA